jgi:1-acyl-sn-glycerol-3-phosphate acyltransferase
MPFWIIRPIVWVLMHISYAILGGIRFEGRENVPLKGGVLITPNHISDADPPTATLALPRSCWIMAKEELFSIRILGKLIRWLHGFPVKRYTADRVALRRAEELLKAGEAVMIFPEGKLSEDGKLQPILPGVLLIAQQANVPIVPTALINTDKLMPYGKTTPRFIKEPVIVRFGPPVTVEELKGGGKGGEALKRGAERLGVLMQAVQDNKPYPPAPPPPPSKRAAKAAAETANALADAGQEDDEVGTMN